MTRSYKSLDIMKFICAILVIAIHTGPFSDYSPDVNYFVCQILSRIAVPFFFTCSGFLFYQKIKESENGKSYFLKYIKRMLILYLIWSVVYIYWNFDFTLIGEGFFLAAKEALWYVWQFIFIGSHFHLWFIPALIFSISVLYAAVYFDKRKGFICFFGIVYIIGLLGDSYYGFVKDFAFNKYIELYFRFFGSTYNGFFFGALYVLIGSVLKGDTLYKKKNLFYSILFFLLLTAESFLLHRQMIPKDYNLYVFLVPFTLFFFRYLLSLKTQSTKASNFLRKMSMDLYFSHCLFLIFIQALFLRIHYENGGLILFFSVTLLSLGFCWVKLKFIHK